MRRHSWAAALGASLCCAALAPSSHAGIITGFGTSVFPGPSTGTIRGSTNPAPSNDNASEASANVIPYTIFFNAIGTLDVEFMVAPSAGTTEYRFTQRLINNSGTPWLGFGFQLGFGVGPAFSPSGTPDLLDFDTPQRDPSPTSSAFPLLVHGIDSLQWSGSALPSIGAVQFEFAVDVPDGLATFNPSGLNRFTLRQAPITQAVVPAPSTLLLLAPLALGLGWARVRQERTG